MKVRLSDPLFLGDLVEFLRRMECSVDPLARDVLEASIARSIPASYEQLELDAFLHVWRALHPGVEVNRLD